ncbi:MAG: hypothetical protein AB7V50_02590 [Vampirovibrionia bacterium]
MNICPTTQRYQLPSKQNTVLKQQNISFAGIKDISEKHVQEAKQDPDYLLKSIYNLFDLMLEGKPLCLVRNPGLSSLIESAINGSEDSYKHFRLLYREGKISDKDFNKIQDYITKVVVKDLKSSVKNNNQIPDYMFNVAKFALNLSKDIFKPAIAVLGVKNDKLTENLVEQLISANNPNSLNAKEHLVLAARQVVNPGEGYSQRAQLVAVDILKEYAPADSDDLSRFVITRENVPVPVKVAAIKAVVANILKLSSDMTDVTNDHVRSEIGLLKIELDKSKQPIDITIALNNAIKAIEPVLNKA